MKVDADTGFPIEAELTQDLFGTITITSPDIPGGEMEIPVSIESRITIEVEEVTGDAEKGE